MQLFDTIALFPLPLLAAGMMVAGSLIRFALRPQPQAVPVRVRSRRR